MKVDIAELSQIPFMFDAADIQPILEGYSEEGKFRVSKGGLNFLVRTFDSKDLARKNVEFAVLANLEAMGVRSSRPIKIGSCSRFGYMVLSFIDGIDGEQALKLMSVEQQYQAGLEAGVELKKMNSLSAPSGISPWEDRRLQKCLRYIASYKSGSEKFKDGGRVVEFVEANLHLLKGRPNTFQHDDFHPRNLIYKEGKLEGVIDFNRYDWGDPIHEFVKVGQFGVELSVPFCIGQLRGYFDGENPGDEFWILYSLYMAMTTFSSIVWTKHACPAEMPDAIERIERFVADHRAFESALPKWYIEFK